MKNVPDLSSLMNMILASPRAKDLFQSFHKEIFSAVLKLEMSTRLQRIIHTVMIVRHHTPLNTTGPDELFRFHLDGDGQAQEIDFLPDPITTLRDTVHSANWIDFFVKSFVNSRIENPGDYSGMPEAPPSSTELHRIRRAFWRLRLYCDLFHGADITPHEPGHSRTQMKGPQTFLIRLCPWEIEEPECVYGYLQTQSDTPNPISRGADKVCSLLEIPFLHRVLVTPGCSERFERLTGHICQPRRFLSFCAGAVSIR